MTQELVNQLIRHALAEGTAVIVLVNYDGVPRVETTLKNMPLEIVMALRSWAAMIEDAHNHGRLIRHSRSAEVLLPA